MRYLILCLIALLAHELSAADFHINSKTGKDSNTGLSPKQAWKSLERLSQKTFQAGDRIFFACDTEYFGTFQAKGSGELVNGKMKTIKVMAYGEGKIPVIYGQGKVLAPIILRDVEGWEIQDLELTNTGSERKPKRYGILIENNNLKVARHIILRDLFIHDVNGAYKKEKGASTAIYLTRKRKSQKPLRYDQVLIEHNYIKNCSRNGIVVDGGNLRDDWFPSTNVVIRKNLIEGVGGDGILPTGCDGVLVEWNTMRDCPYLGKEGGAAAGMWPWNCDNAIFQYNEVTDHKAWHDGQAYDCDYSCKNTIFRYNLSYENFGGFMLLCSPGKHKKGWLKNSALNKDSLIHYNLSLNDGGRDEKGSKPYYAPTFSFSGQTTENSKITKNIIIRTKQRHAKDDPKLLSFNEWGGRTAVGTKIIDNYFIFDTPYKGQIKFHRTIRDTLIKDNKFYGNWSAIPKNKFVKTDGNAFSDEKVKIIEMKGEKKHIDKFRRFLNAKKNPQTKLGYKIKWIPLD